MILDAEERKRILDGLRAYDREAGWIVASFLQEISLTEVYARLTYDYVSKAGSSRFIRTTWLELLDADAEKLINFYLDL